MESFQCLKVHKKLNVNNISKIFTYTSKTKIFELMELKAAQLKD